MRAMRAVGAAVVLAILMVGVPGLLVVVGSLPPWDRLGEVLTGPDDGRVLMGLLTLVGWAAWLVVMAAVSAELVAVLSRQRLRPRLPGLGWLQGTMGLLVVAALGALVPPTAATAQLQEPPRQVQQASRAGHSVPAEAGSDRAADEARRGPGVNHRVRAGDDLWSLAEHYYRDGTRWRQIATANPELLTGGPDVLETGWELFIPTADAAAPGATVRVAAGDTLTGLAAEHLGATERWPELFQANRAVLADPDDLPVGLMLRLPERVTEPTTDPGTTTDESGGTEKPKADGEEQPTGNDGDPERATPPEASPTPAPPPGTTGPPRTEQAEPETRPEPETALDLEQASVLGGIGALLAAGLTGSFAARRLIQLQERPVGRRVARPEPSAQRLSAALHTVGSHGGRDGLTLAQDLVARHCRELDSEPPHLDHVLVGDERVQLIVAQAGSPPAGFGVDGSRWTLTAAERPPLAEATAPLWPALVPFGRVPGEDGEVHVDLERLGDLGVDLDDLDDSRAFVRGLLLALIAGPGAGQVIAVGVGQELITTADPSHVRYRDDIDAVLADLEDRAAHQRRTETVGSPRRMRLDVDCGDAWQPVVLLLDVDLTAHQRRRLQDLIDDPRTPLAVVRSGAPGATNLTGNRVRAHLEARRVGVSQLNLTPHLVSEPAHAAVIDLFRATGTTTTTPAPWWSPAPTSGGATEAGLSRTPHVVKPVQEPPVPADDKTTPPRTGGVAPMIRLLGPIDLESAAGPEPTRARKQCIEYCAWLLENPGRSSREMAAQLFVAEPTRRSNMSRLRTWLGHDPAGRPYLPEAYSGRITLHEEVTSDWQLFDRLLPGDIRAARNDTLVAGLELVHGAPLADAAPQQWGWAEELRLDMVSKIRDAAFVLAERAAEAADLELVRWATSRGLAAAPEDERLLTLRVRAEYRAGNVTEAERLSRRIIARARQLDMDLLEETVDVLQAITEGQVRARRAL